jgi:hypothetical protein
VIERDKVVEYDEDLIRLFPMPNAKANAKSAGSLIVGADIIGFVRTYVKTRIS